MYSSSTFKVLVTLSLSANAVLAIVLLRPMAAQTVDRTLAPVTLQTSQSGQPERSFGGASQTTPASTTRLWTRFSNGSLQELRQRLEAAGFPRSMAYEIVSEVVWDSEDGRRRHLAARDAVPYWRNAPPDDPKEAEAIGERVRQNLQTLNEVFGPLGAQSEDGLQRLRRSYGDLPVEKLERLLAVENDYRDLSMQLRPKGAGEAATVHAQLALLNEQQRADIETLLTPAELFEYDLRRSRAGAQLASQLEHFRTTESEFRTLFPVYRDAMQQLDQQEFSDPAAARAAHAATESELQPKIRATLGEARYADYVQATDRESEKLNRVAARFDLSLHAAAQVAAARRDITARAEVLRRDASLNAAQRSAALAALHSEATSKITTALGPRAADAYVSYDGRWLQQLATTAPIR